MCKVMGQSRFPGLLAHLLHQGWKVLTCAPAGRLAPSIAPTEDDQEALTTARTLLSLLQVQPAAGLPQDPATWQRAAQLARELQPLLPELLPGIAVTGEPPSPWNLASWQPCAGSPGSHKRSVGQTFCDYSQPLLVSFVGVGVGSCSIWSPLLALAG